MSGGGDAAGSPLASSITTDMITNWRNLNIMYILFQFAVYLIKLLTAAANDW